ncbi:MAG TPA: hypothetical protein DD671_04085 [Balneolaceae bacterium]|nr:hypothetical protein [Balneolaceae bacterium]
MLLGLFLIIV